MKLIVFLGWMSLLTAGCGHFVEGVLTSETRRIWVVVDRGKVFRCADAYDGDQPPRPVCVRAPLASSGD